MLIKQIRYSSHFLRKLRKISQKEKTLLSKIEQIFRANCFDPRLKTHKLSGKLEEFWSFPLSYKTRVLFKLNNKNSVIFIDIGSHSIYK